MSKLGLTLYEDQINMDYKKGVPMRSLCYVKVFTQFSVMMPMFAKRHYSNTHGQLFSETRPQNYKTLVHSQTQNDAQ